MKFLLRHLRWIKDGIECTSDFRITRSRISEIGNLQPLRHETVIDLEGHSIYPGLINAHDHLEMNLYPKLGRPPYNNYVEWANDIYTPDRSPVKEIQSIHLNDRLIWGVCKNIISGVTTVIHHNDFYRPLNGSLPLRVYKNYTWAHSVAFDKHIGLKYRIDRSYIIHAAEGCDDLSCNEIQTLERLGLLQSNTILVHGIAISQDQAENLSKIGCGLVWCPASNYFMFGKTAIIEILKTRIPVLLGTDSTMTGSPTFYTEMRTAFNSGLASPLEIYTMATSLPDSHLKISPHHFSEGVLADVLILPSIQSDYYLNLIHSTPSETTLLLIDGKPVFADRQLLTILNLRPNIVIGESQKWIDCDIKALKSRIKKKVDIDILNLNPLWNLINAEP